ncbi:MAG: hypothetical protein OXH90_06150 [Paracoccaceae bacterium]|nr:hypothetical protein [Paracoccaceae bacterium]MDE2917731.1 hypothetical protein [Paracoccaceae bacterium]
MLNNLNSVHSAVAESKAEREQYDRLLILSTPRERLLILITALLLVVSGIWFFAGNYKHTISANGMLVEFERPSNVEKQMVDLIVWVRTGDKAGLVAGMPVQLIYDSATDDGFFISGNIAQLSSLTALNQSEITSLITELVDGSLYQVRISLSENLDISSILNKELVIIFQLASVTPFQYFLMS